MNKFILCLLILFPILLSAQVELYHQVPLVIDQSKKVEFVVEVRKGYDQVARASFFYRAAGEISYTQLEMSLGSETRPELTLTFSDLLSFPTGLEYYFEVYDYDDNLLLSYPSIRPELNPLKVTGKSVPAETSDFILLSPDQDYEEEGDDLIIAISFFSITQDIDLESITFVINGNDKTTSTQIGSNMLVYKEINPKPGNYNFQIKARYKDGSPAYSKQWSTVVKGKTYDFLLNYRGSVTFNSKYAKTDFQTDANDNETDKYADVDLRFSGDYKIMDFNSRIFLSSLETKDNQSVNRYQLGVGIPHFKLIGGDHNPYLSDLTAKGKNIRGIHTLLEFDKFKLMASYGNLKRSIKGEAYQDTTESGTEFTDYKVGSFRRETFNLRTQIGTERTFFWALNIVKAKDKLNSLSRKYYISAADSLPSFTPKDNLILSMDTRLSLFRQRLIWGAEVGMSLYNSNIIGGAISLDSLEAEFGHDINFDPQDFEAIFIINKNVEPILPNLSNLAYRTYIRYFFRGNLLNVSYSATGASYNSLAASYIPKDARIISVIDNLALMNGRLNFNLGFNYVSDNVYDEKSTTTKNTGFFVQSFYQPVDLPYFSIGYNGNYIENGYEEEDDNSYALDIGTGNFNFNLGYEFENIGFGPLNLVLGYNNSYNRDNQNESFDYRRNHLNFSMKSDFRDIPMKAFLSYSVSLNDNETRTFDDSLQTWVNPVKEESAYNSLFAGCEFNFLQERLKPFFDFKYSFYTGDIDRQNLQMINLGSSYKVMQGLFCFLETGIKLFRNKDQEDQDYNRYNLRFKLNYRF